MYMLDHLFPDCCPICLKPVHPKGGVIHRDCKGKLNFIKDPFCLKCGRQIGDEGSEYCMNCRKTKRSFEAGRCTFNYHSAIEGAIKLFKEEGTREIVDFFARATVERCGSFIRSVNADAFVPVPLSADRLRRRGFNQADLFAIGLSKYTDIPVERLLKKIRRTGEQKGLNRWERENNLSGAFGVDAKIAQIPDTVILADDVFTTGSTVNTCAATLKAAGVKKVYFRFIAAVTADI